MLVWFLPIWLSICHFSWGLQRSLSQQWQVSLVWFYACRWVVIGTVISLNRRALAQLTWRSFHHLFRSHYAEQTLAHHRYRLFFINVWVYLFYVVLIDFRLFEVNWAWLGRQSIYHVLVLEFASYVQICDDLIKQTPLASLADNVAVKGLFSSFSQYARKIGVLVNLVVWVCVTKLLELCQFLLQPDVTCL